MEHTFFNVIFGVLVSCLYICSLPCTGEKIRYIITEHPNVTYIDHVHCLYANMTSRRYGRNSPVYYVGIHVHFTIPLDKNLRVDFYFYEYLTNMYKRGFVEMHYNFCDLMNDNFFGAPMRQGKLKGPCPYPPGVYHFYNMSIDVQAIPRSFPFTKGRIYANFTYKTTLIGAGYIDMEVKEMNIRRSKKPLILLS